MGGERTKEPSFPGGPIIPPTRRLPELTARAVALGILLSVLLAAANAYLGLFAGTTVSASIPAAVVSMAVLRVLRRGNILENNMVQTAASAGEALAAGVIFTIPALVIGAFWGKFHYWETSIIACVGGVLGVMFTIPLRRAMIVEMPLQFPEGIATAEVLKAGEGGGPAVKYLLGASLVGIILKVCGSGFRLWQEIWVWARAARGTVLYFGINLSPALVAIGYIVGLNISVLIFLGGAINWWVAIPLVVALDDQFDPGALGAATLAEDVVWLEYTRFIGVGSMAVGGLWALFRLRKNLASGLRSGMHAYRTLRQGASSVPATERDTPMPWVAMATGLCAVPLFALFYHFTAGIAISLLMAVVMLVAGFLFSAVAAYMAGLVGSSNNPISGVTIATVLTVALLLWVLLGDGNRIGPVAAILIGATVCCAAAIGGDNMQDLKAGYLVGATPWKQQLMQLIGVVAAAFVIAPVLTLLHTSYGIGPEPTPAAAAAVTRGHAQAPAPSQPTPPPLAATASAPSAAATSTAASRRLDAPQATLTHAVAGLAAGLRSSGLPWAMIFLGVGVAVAIILFDLALEARKSAFRTPVLAVAIGLYLPFYLSTVICAGGVIAWAAGRIRGSEAAKARDQQHGVLFAAGLVTGEALAGIGLAIPIVVSGKTDVLQLLADRESVLGFLGPAIPWPGVVLLGLVMYGLYRVATRGARLR